jgi:lipoate-protein ligase B
MGYLDALAMQTDLVDRRKRGEIPDQLLIVEHPHVITMGRNGHAENLLASPEILERAGIELHHTDRGGDVTYHGPGQIVGYPIVDLREWKRDVVAYLRALEQVLIDALAEIGVAIRAAQRSPSLWLRLSDGSLNATCTVRRWRENDRRRNAPDGREYCRRNLDQVAEEAWGQSGARRAAV